uniref:CRISPR system endoribonuclease Csx1-like HEPN domain-containing protein n=1 Tax=Archaeoglobus fulgidus TaxID=2234 RepID=A0A7J2TK71_ARCFL
MKILAVFGKAGEYKEVKFEINGSVFCTYFVTEALRRYFGDGAEVLIFAPSSLLNLYGGMRGFESKLKELGHEGFRIFEIPPLGDWAKFSDVIVAIFLKLVEERPGNVIVNITTGLNIYTFALVDAVRRYVTYRQLERILQGGEFEAKVSSHPPPSTSEILKVELYDLPVMTFFSLPETNLDKLYEGNGKRAGEIGKRYADLKKKFRELLRELRIAFNSIRYNTPLAFYELLRFDLDTEETERGILAYCNEYLKNKINLDLRRVTNAFYAIAMMRSFKEFMNSLKEPSTEELKERFLELYKNSRLGLGVNGYFLHNDIKRIESLVSKHTFDGKRTILELEHKSSEFKSSKGFSKDMKRNFFAHSGFLKEWTEVELKNGKVILGWKKEWLNEIENWILKPEF